MAAKCFILASAFPLVTGFMPTGMHSVSAKQGRTVLMAAESGDISRRDSFLGLAGAAAVLGGAAPAFAGYLSGDGPEVGDPTKAVVENEEMFGSSQFKQQVGIIDGYIKITGQVRALVQKDGQADIYKALNKAYDISKLRDALYKLSTSVFDEDTQRGTDRLVRVITQDVVELEASSKTKDGKPRSAKKLLEVEGKLDKLERDLVSLRKFFG